MKSSTETGKSVIVIIGGGFCGTTAAIQLGQRTDKPLSIYIINKEHPLSRGIAYSTYNANHLLNVAAGRMSIFPDKPAHFCEWILSKPGYAEYHVDSLPELFLPRVIYGSYLEEVFGQFRNNLPSSVDLTILNDEAIDILFENNHPLVRLKSGKSVKADKIILATGNFVPAEPRIENPQFYKNNTGFFKNPWTADAVSGLENEKEILIIGTGLTMVDNVLSLEENGFKGKITAISTKGFFPLSHKKSFPYTAIRDELKTTMPLVEQYHIFKKHIRQVLKAGITGEVVVDAVRPLTQEIWQALSQDEKNSFMQHIRHLWGVARHRLPAEVHQKIMGMMDSGKLKIIAGRLHNLESIEGSSKIKASVRQRKTCQIIELEVDRVINCTGPQSDIRKIENTLFVNLTEKGILIPDAMRLGVQAMPDGTIISDPAIPQGFIYTLGSNLKGILWESVAVPELRVQAEKLAGKLLNQINEEPVVARK